MLSYIHDVKTAMLNCLEISTDIYVTSISGVSSQLQSSGLVAHENSTFRNLALAVSGPFMA